jgi:membrane fusion protein (multidrug efflux system)
MPPQGTQTSAFTTLTNGSGGHNPVSVASALGTDGDKIDHPLDSEVMADSRGTRMSRGSHSAFPEPERKKRHLVRRLVILAILAGIIAAAIHFGLPLVREALDTESTDDAFVTAYRTNTSSRIEGLVTEVLVDKNDRVEPGMLLALIDRVPYELAVAQSEAALQQSRADLDRAKTIARGQLAVARSSWYRKKNAQEQLRRQVASLRAQVAALNARLSSEKLAEIDQRRIENLVKRGSATQSELDQRNNTLEVASQQVKQAWADIQETRAALGLPPNTENPLDIPKDLEREQSSVQSSLSDIASTLFQLGIPFDIKDIGSAEDFNKLLNVDLSEGLEAAVERLIDKAPGIAVAKAAVVRSERQLDDTKLRLSYTEIRSEIAGYVEDRSANPGNRVEPGQTLISIRQDDVWIEANFKETQIGKIKIGMPVDLYVDAYPRKVFKARVSGFSPATGLAGSILPPENATGNYVKVVQRLPVRLDLTEGNPRETPLFVGLSVEPYVKYKEQPTGHRAGERLHSRQYPSPPAIGGGPAGTSPSNLKLEASGRSRP